MLMLSPAEIRTFSPAGRGDKSVPLEAAGSLRRSVSTRLRSSPSVIQAKTRSCNVARHLRAARRRPGPTAQSQTQTSASRPGSRRADLAVEAERLRRRRASRACSAFQAVRRSPGQRLHLVGIGQCAQHRQAGAAADVAGDADARRRRLGGRASRTGRCRGTGSTTGRMRDLRAGVAQRRAVGVVEPDAVREHARAMQQAGARVDVEVAARLRETARAPSAPRRGSRPRGSACRALGSAAAERARPSRAAPACWSARSAPSPRRRGGRGRASARSARGSRARRCSTSSRRPSGAWRSISTLPAMTRMPRASAAANSASTEALCTVGKTTAAVVPCASSASRKQRRAGLGDAPGRHSAARPGRCRCRASRAARCRSSRSRRAAGCARGCR